MNNTAEDTLDNIIVKISCDAFNYGVYCESKQINDSDAKLTAIENQAKAAIAAYTTNKIIEARIDEQIAIKREQEKYLQDMTLEDGKTVIKALAVGMMYATVNNRQAKCESELKALNHRKEQS